MNIEAVIAALRNFIKAFSKPSMNEIYSVAAANLGKRLTLNNFVPQEVGCAEAVSWILLNAGFPVPDGGLQSVNALIDWMLANGFEETHAPMAGAIITAHSPNRTSPSYAHTGVCLNYGIGSNTSSNGRFQQNYSYRGWTTYFGAHGSVTRCFYHA